MPAYPTSNPAWKTPVTRSLKFDTGIMQGTNGVEQRWMRDLGVETWSLPYPLITLAQRNTLFAAFEAAKGAYDQTISLAFDGTTYTGLYFDGDTLPFTESRPTMYSGTVKLTTTVRPVDSGTLPTDFPNLSTGAVTQLPYTKSSGFDTVSVRTDGGRFAYPKRNTALHSWTAGGTVLTKAEAQAVWDCFRLAGGMLKSIAFTDPDSITRYSNCRFLSDSITWTIIAPGQHSITCAIQELA